MHLIVFAL